MPLMSLEQVNFCSFKKVYNEAVRKMILLLTFIGSILGLYVFVFGLIGYFSTWLFLAGAIIIAGNLITLRYFWLKIPGTDLAGSLASLLCALLMCFVAIVSIYPIIFGLTTKDSYTNSAITISFVLLIFFGIFLLVSSAVIALINFTMS